MSELAGPRQLRRLLDAVVSLGADVELPVMLHHIVEAGRELVGARYAALGVQAPSQPSLAAFITSGMDDDGVGPVGEPPEGHGILGLLISSPQPLRLADLGGHPDRFGFPVGHPPMRSFLGVPLQVQGRVFGNLYFTEKLDGEEFTAVDEELAVALAASAAVAIDNVRLHERTQELSLLADRERLSLELHDTVIQQIFGTGLALHRTARLSQEPEVKSRILDHVDALDEVVRQLRLAIFELDVSPTAVGDLRHEILAVSADAARSLGYSPALRLRGAIESLVDDAGAAQIGAVLREALSNVARHSRATQVEIGVTVEAGVLTLEVEDDGIGIAPDAAHGDGLENIFRRAELLGGSARVTPGASGGTAVFWSVPTRE